MKHPRFNQKGITHLLAPLLFVVIFASIGSYAILRSKAATINSADGGGGSVSPYGYMVGGFVRHGDTNLQGAYVHFSYTRNGHKSAITLPSRGKGWYQFRAYPNTTYTISADYIYKPTNAAKTLGMAWVSDPITLKTGNNVGNVKNKGLNIFLTKTKNITTPECLGNLQTCSSRSGSTGGSTTTTVQ